MMRTNPDTGAERAGDSCSDSSISQRRHGESGYALVALLAVMSIMALLLTAAVPNIRQQAQRSLEAEAIWRGEQVAEAIRLYARAHGGQLPTSIDQLLEGNPRGSQRVQILRPAAARDPLSSTGEWKLIRPNDPALTKFQAAVTIYAGGRTPPTRDPLIQNFQRRLGTIINLGGSEDAPGGEDSSPDSSGPFIGVASRSQRDSVITYYGIERHDQWIFTPLFR